MNAEATSANTRPFPARGYPVDTYYLIFAVLLAVLPFLYWEGTMDFSAVPRYTAIALIPPLLLLGMLLRGFKAAHSYSIDPVTLILGVILLWSIASQIWAIDPHAAFSEVIQMASLFLVLLLSIELHKKRELVDTTIVILLTGATLVSIIGLQQSFGVNLFGYKQSHVPAATFLNKNIASLYLDLVIPLYVYFLLYARTNAVRWLTAIAFAVAISYDVTIYSRGSWLGLIGASIMLLVIAGLKADLRHSFREAIKQNTGKLLLVCALVVLINILPQQIPDYSLGRTNIVQTDTNMRIRLHAYINTIDMILDKPFTGTGIGGFMLGFREHMFSPLAVPNVKETMYMVNLHNDPLQMVAELGIVGSILLAFFIILMFRLYRHVIGNSNIADKTKFVILLSCLTASGIHSLVDFPLHRPTSAALFFVILGMLLAIYHNTPGGIKLTMPTNWLKYLAIPGIVLLLFSFFGFYRDNIHNSTNMKFANYYAQVAHNTEIASEKMSACISAMHYARRTDYASSYASKILLPLIYTICETNPSTVFSYMNHVLAYDPNNSTALLTRGMIYVQTKNLELAADDYNRAIDILPNRPAGYIGLARISELIGRPADAVLLYEKALELEPENKTAKAALANTVQ